jgi:hypothetical protein
MPDDIRKVVIETRRPRGQDPGAIAEGWFKVVNGYVTLCNEDGIAVSGVDKRPVTHEGNERTIAALMLRERTRATARARSFNRPIQYPKTGWC